jgi:diacylglycerol kinase (ATP)
MNIILQTLKNIPTRATRAMGFSLAGLSSAFKKEESIRLETIGLIILVIAMCFVPWPLWKKGTLIAVYLLIPLIEIINSALEDICDLVSPDYNEKVKWAKDKGSAAVLIAIILTAVTLVTLIVHP